MPLSLARNYGCRISADWTYKGLRALVIENDLLRVTVLLDKGTDIVEFRYKPRDLDFLLMQPGGIRNPRLDPPSAYTDSPFLDFYSGGWNEILPSGGPGVTYEGAAFGQHGEISLIPWECAILDDTPEHVAAKMWVRPLRTPFFLEKTMHMDLGRAVLRIEERLVNEGGQPVHLMWGQHIAFGRPFMDHELVIDAPARRLLTNPASPAFGPRRIQPGASFDWPQAVDPTGAAMDPRRVPAFGAEQAMEMAYLTDLPEGWYAITNPSLGLGFGTHFDPALYRYIWMWQNLGHVSQGFPWWGRTHCMALEPWTSYPTGGLPEAIANGTALLMQPGEVRETAFTAVAFEGQGGVQRITAAGDVTL